jgi:3-phenylpropionate/trans-cinnamate dioxygenase ferredoxin reductase subunit
MEAHLPYQKPPLSKGFLKGASKIDSLFFKSKEYYEKNKIEVLTETRATKIDTTKQKVSLEGGGRLKYNKLVLATGSDLNKITSREDKKIIYLNTLSRATELKKQLETSKSVSIIGAGYIGLEVAATANMMGLKTSVLEAQERVMQRSSSKQISNFIQNYHEKKGVKFKLETTAEKIEPTSQGINIQLSDGQTDKPDFVVIGVGVSPACSIALEAGIECEDGILVNENCLTSNKNIYAAGDCVSHYFSRYGFRQRLESVQNAVDQASVVSSSIMGEPTRYNSVPWFWSDQYDLKLQIAGLSQSCELVLVRGRQGEHKFSVCHFKDNKLMAVECVNDQKTFMLGKKLIEASSDITPKAMEDEHTNLKDWL